MSEHASTSPVNPTSMPCTTCSDLESCLQYVLNVVLECIISYVLLVEYSQLDKGKRDTRQYTRVELYDTVCVFAV